MTDLRSFPDPDLWADALADALAAQLRTVLDARGRASFVVAGGGTPGPVYDRLARAKLDWAGVTILPSDERCVPVSHPESNARMIAARLLVGPAAAARFLPLYADGADPIAAAAAACPRVADLGPVDLALLGMGTDGHTASLFPGARGLAAALDPDAPPVLPIWRADGGAARLTLSLAVLAGAGAITIALRGADKRATLGRVAAPGPVEDLPTRGVLDRAVVYWTA